MAGQAPFQPLDFAMGNRPTPAPQGFNEQDLPGSNVAPMFTEETFQGLTEAASDEALQESPKHLSTPSAIQSLLAKGQRDASDEEGFTDSLTSSEKIALGLLAVMPLIGGAIGGDDGGLIGAGAAGQGLATFGNVKLKEGAAKKKVIREQEKFERSEAGREKRSIRSADATTKAQGLALEKEKRVRRQALSKDWRKDEVRTAYDKVRASDGKLQAALNGKDGVSNLVAIIAFHKGLDPGSVVRDSEVVMVQRAQGMLFRMQNILGAATGRTLGPAAKAQMSKLSREFVAIHGELARSRANDFRTEAESFGINADFVVPPEFFKSLSGTVKETKDGSKKGEGDSGAQGSPSGNLNKSADGKWRLD